MDKREAHGYSKGVPEREGAVEKDKFHKCHVPPMKVNCDLEVGVENKNKIIYVCPRKIQYFTVDAKCCSCDKTIEIEYCGCNIKCICGEVVICGCLGYYKVTNSGIIFIPRHYLSKINNDLFPTDILCFKVKDRCNKENKPFTFEVVFTYSKCADCDLNKGCKLNKLGK